MENEIAVVRIKLKDAPVPIWRRIHLNPNINLDEFHEIVQIVMGWENYHLYGYNINNEHYLPREAAFSNICTDDLILKDVMESNKKFIYQYDMGDSWEHEIVFNKYIEPKKDVKYPICTSEKGICPPEDIGGVWGYGEFLNEAHSEDPAEFFWEWIGEVGYEIDEIKEIEKIPLDIDSINQALEVFRE